MFFSPIRKPDFVGFETTFFLFESGKAAFPPFFPRDVRNLFSGTDLPPKILICSVLLFLPPPEGGNALLLANP